MPRRVCKDTTRSISIILVWHILGWHPLASLQSVGNQWCFEGCNPHSLTLRPRIGEWPLELVLGRRKPGGKGRLIPDYLRLKFARTIDGVQKRKLTHHPVIGSSISSWLTDSFIATLYHCKLLQATKNSACPVSFNSGSDWTVRRAHPKISRTPGTQPLPPAQVDMAQWRVVIAKW